MMNLEKFQNFIKLHLCICEAAAFCRKKFYEKYSQEFKKNWNDGKVDASFFSEDKRGQKIKEKIEKKGSRFELSLDSGNSLEWDLCIFGPILSMPPFAIKKCTQIDKLIEIRNEISHMTNMNITNDEYEKIFQRFSDSMKKLGYSQNDLDTLKNNLEMNQQMIRQTVNQNFVELSKIAEKELNDGNFEKVVEIFCQISLIDLSNEELCQFFYTRSLAYSKLHEISKRRDLKNAYKALNDAENICLRKPDWSNGYQRTAEVYVQLDEYENAKQCYEKALCLDIDNVKLKNELAFVKNVLLKQSRNDHLNEKSMPYTSEEGFENFLQKNENNRGYTLAMTREIERDTKIMFDPSFKDVFMGHEFLNGSKDIRKNPKEAAAYYSKAAQKGNAEALYNLGILHMEGDGVKNDYRAGLNFIAQAASKTSFIGSNELIRNVGVAEAEHTLGD